MGSCYIWLDQNNRFICATDSVSVEMMLFSSVELETIELNNITLTILKSSKWSKKEWLEILESSSDGSC